MSIYERESFQTLFDAMEDFSFILDFEGNLVMTNKALLSKLGFKKDELIGQPISIINPNSQENEIIKSIKSIVEGKSMNFKTNISTHKSIEIPVEIKFVLGDWEGKPAIYAIAKEYSDIIISSGIKAEKELLSNKIKYKQLIEGFDEAFFILSGSKIIYTSPVFEKMFGIEGEDAFDGIKSIFKIVHPDDKRYMLRAFIKNRKFTNLQLNETFRIIRPDGYVCWLWIKDFTIKGEEKKNVKFGIILDITSQKQTEVRIMDIEKHIHLETLRSEFFSNISHELRTPISIITSSIHLLENIYNKDIHESLDKEKVNKYFKSINQNSLRLLRIVNNIIDITRIDAGFIEPQYSNCNIISVIEDIADSVVKYGKERGITIIFDTDIEEKVIAIDQEKIERVILNLISNALKQTDSGGTIWINVHDNGSTVKVSVKDDGTGIDESMQERIFEKFGQVDKSLTRRAEGSGVGLYLTKALVEMHKGNISVKSTVGEGSEFIFELPAVLCKEGTCQKKCERESKTLIQKINIEFSDIYSK